MNEIEKFINDTQSTNFAHEVLLRALFQALNEEQIDAIAKHAAEDFEAFEATANKDTIKAKIASAKIQASAILGKNIE